MDRLYLWLHSQSDGHGLVTGSHQPIPYGLVTTWHCGDMTRMALDKQNVSCHNLILTPSHFMFAGVPKSARSNAFIYSQDVFLIVTSTMTC